ncbi:MAG: TadE/TadG family type IV pilus assembly protein [Actinomycetota bacterium]
MEFALVLPLLLVLALGLVQVGLLARDRLLVEAAARAGARAAAIQEDPAEVDAAVHAAAPALDPAATFVTVTREGARGLPVTVQVIYEDVVRVPLVGWLIGSAVRLSSTAVMRQEFG